MTKNIQDDETILSQAMWILVTYQNTRIYLHKKYPKKGEKEGKYNKMFSNTFS